MTVALIAVLLARPAGALEPVISPNAIPKARPAAAAAAFVAANTWEVARICDAIKSAADHHGLPRPFFTRLIWKESRFDIKAVSPVGAQGIAQFMPATAKARGLADPFDPEQAIPASAHFLADLRAQFGNWGLAAAAYNGGPDRVSRYLRRRSGLPYETLDYVESITFRPADWFRTRGREVEHRPLEEGVAFDEACRKIPIVQTRSILAAASGMPWTAQLAAGISRSAAQRALGRARKQHRRLVGGKPTVIRRIKTGGIRRYIAGIGLESRGQARAICAQIQARRGHCVVRRN
ncbi:MAG: lytic transglycosylase domain-containing protein [Pseudomonadota bacterium]